MPISFDDAFTYLTCLNGDASGAEQFSQQPSHDSKIVTYTLETNIERQQFDDVVGT